MGQYLLGTTELDGVVLARTAGRDSIDAFSELIALVSTRCGPDVASLFAEPVRGLNRTTNVQNVTWFSAYEGTPFAISQLDASAQTPVVALLRKRLATFKDLFSDPEHGATFASWLYLLSPSDVLSISGQPILKNWGMIPAAAAASEEAREATFGRSIESYLPKIPLPPFNAQEAQSFPQRLAQLDAREESIAARPTLMKASRMPADEALGVTQSKNRALQANIMAPLVAVLVAGATLAAINVFDILRYPDLDPERVTAERLALQKSTNGALEERLSQLKSASSKVCQLVPGAKNPPGAEDFQKLLPAAPERTQVPVAPRADGQSQSSTVADLLDKATVLIINKNSIGSGFFISDRYIVTNHHVVGNASEVMIGSKALGGLFPAHVIAVGTGATRGTQDLAVLETDPRPTTLALRVGVVPDRLRPVMASGYPGAVISTQVHDRDLPEANLTAGIVTSHQTQQPDGIGTIIHTAQIGHGNSGGPLVDDGACAVGVNSWLSLDADRSQSYQTYNQSLDASELRKFLDSKNIQYASAASECAPTPQAPAAPPASATPPKK